MALRRTLVALPQLFGLVLFFARPAEARIVDRIAGIAGSHVIMLSEVQREAAPYVRAIQEKDPRARARAETKALHEACERLIDAALEGDEAERLHVEVTAQEVDVALDMLAKSRETTREGLTAAAAEAGMNETAYRDGIRRELLEAKLLQLRHADLGKWEQSRAALAADLRAKVYVEDRMSS